MAGIRRVSDLGSQGVKTILDGSVQTSDLANGSVTQSKLSPSLSAVTVTTSSLRSTAVPAPFEGQQIYETDTDILRFWDGSSWVRVISGKTYPGQNIKTTIISSNLTQKIYAATNDNIYNANFTTNDIATVRLLFNIGIAYEYNTSTDVITFALNINGVEQFSFGDSTNTVTWNEFPFYTFPSLNTYSPNTNIGPVRLYVKSASGTVVCPRSVGGPVNFSMTIEEIAV
jgi:hypothetical protein